MGCSSPFVGIIILILGTLFYSVAAMGSTSLLGYGYLCDTTHIPVEKLKEAATAAEATASYEMISRNLYEGLPFNKPYILWPVSLNTNSYEQATNGPYRVVLDEKFKVFSVVIKNEIGIRECELLDDTEPIHVPYNFHCDKDVLRFEGLKAAVEQACSKIRKIPDQNFPIRYDGFHFQQNGLQRYMFPVFPSGKIWHKDEDPGSFRVIMNSECSILGVVDFSDQLSRPCRAFGVRKKSFGNYW